MTDNHQDLPKDVIKPHQPKKYKYTMKTGRPTKYKPEYCNQIIEFVKQAKTDSPKFLTRFADSINVCTDTLNEWTKRHKDFSVAYRRALTYHADFVAEQALVGNYNAAFAIFYMKNCAGWTDKQEIKHEGIKPNLTIIAPEGYKPKKENNRLSAIQA